MSMCEQDDISAITEFASNHSNVDAVYGGDTKKPSYNAVLHKEETKDTITWGLMATRDEKHASDGQLWVPSN